MLFLIAIILGYRNLLFMGFCYFSMWKKETFLWKADLKQTNQNNNKNYKQLEQNKKEPHKTHTNHYNESQSKKVVNICSADVLEVFLTSWD